MNGAKVQLSIFFGGGVGFGGWDSSTSGQSMVPFFPFQTQFVFLSLDYCITATQKMKLQQEKTSELESKTLELIIYF